MAASLPVVASRIGQLGELITNEVTGLLCPPGDIIALADALDRLRREPNFRFRLGQAARTTVLRDHTWDAAVRHILHLAGLLPSAQAEAVEVNS
jgi:glycosyltransferase involved in cell wall biosynthesis